MVKQTCFKSAVESGHNNTGYNDIVYEDPKNAYLLIFVPAMTTIRLSQHIFTGPLPCRYSRILLYSISSCNKEC